MRLKFDGQQAWKEEAYGPRSALISSESYDGQGVWKCDACGRRSALISSERYANQQTLRLRELSNKRYSA